MRLAPNAVQTDAPGAADAGLAAAEAGPDSTNAFGAERTAIASRTPLSSNPDRPSHAQADQPGALRAPTYYRVEDLDQRPLVQVSVEPQFPRAAPGETRQLVLQLYVNEFGRVDDVRIETPGFLDGPFEASAREAFSGARFVPGVKNGIAVKSLLRIEVRFGEPPPVDTLPKGDGRPERIVVPPARGGSSARGQDS